MAITYEYDQGRATCARMSLAEWLAIPIDSRRGTIAGKTAALVYFRAPGVLDRIPVVITPAAAPTRRRKRSVGADR